MEPGKEIVFVGTPPYKNLGEVAPPPGVQPLLSSNCQENVKDKLDS